MSGGLDSALLYHLLLKESQKVNPELQLDVLVIDRHQAMNRVRKIIEHNKNPKISVQIFSKKYQEESWNGVIRDTVLDSLNDGYDMIYTGVNQNPPENLYPLNGKYPERPKTNPFEKLKMPFMHLYKFEIVELLLLEGLKDLISLTHSCTENPNTPCTHCFACEERQLALRLNNL